MKQPSPNVVIAVVVAIIAVLVAFTFWIAPRTALVSYLATVVAWSAMSIGSLLVLLMTYLVRGEWTEGLHGPLRAAVMTIPISSILFIPILIGLRELYPWATDNVADPGSFKAIWLTPWFFVLRSVVYFTIWSALGCGSLLAWGDLRRMNRVAAAGLILYALTASLAGVDWIESLTPGFHSSVYGLTFLTLQLLAGFAFALLMVLRRTGSAAAYGAILLSAILLWAYNYAMQYIVMWSANIPSEVSWYLLRSSGFWGWALIVLVAVQFIVPFFALLSERVRGSAMSLACIAGLTVVMRCVEAYWLVVPGTGVDGWSLAVAAPLMVVAVGMVWLATFRYAMRIELNGLVALAGRRLVTR
jgi:hypothetical protein